MAHLIWQETSSSGSKIGGMRKVFHVPSVETSYLLRTARGGSTVVAVGATPAYSPVGLPCDTDTLRPTATSISAFVFSWGPSFSIPVKRFCSGRNDAKLAVILCTVSQQLLCHNGGTAVGDLWHDRHGFLVRIIHHFGDTRHIHSADT